MASTSSDLPSAQRRLKEVVALSALLSETSQHWETGKIYLSMTSSNPPTI